MALGKKKAAAKKEEKPAVVKKGSVSAPPAEKGGRKVLKFNLAQGKATVQEGDKKAKVAYHQKRSTGQILIGLPGQGSIPVEDWLSGKADLKL